MPILGYEAKNTASYQGEIKNKKRPVILIVQRFSGREHTKYEK